MKECRDCGETKPLDSFTKNKKSKGGFHGRCKRCISKRYRERWANDPAWAAKQRHKYRVRSKNRKPGWSKERRREKMREYRKSPDKMRKDHARLIAKFAHPTHSGVCEGCFGFFEYLERHHIDYEQPALILWFCRACHGLTRFKRCIPLPELSKSTKTERLMLLVRRWRRMAELRLSMASRAAFDGARLRNEAYAYNLCAAELELSLSKRPPGTGERWPEAESVAEKVQDSSCGETHLGTP